MKPKRKTEERYNKRRGQRELVFSSFPFPPFLVFETRSCFATQVGLELKVVLLPQRPECQKYRFVLLYVVQRDLTLKHERI